MSETRIRRPALRWIILSLAVLTVLTLAIAGWRAWRQRQTQNSLLNDQALAEQTAQSLPQYSLDVTFDPDADQAGAVMTLDYVNLYESSQDRLYFYIWPNSYSDEDYGIFEGEEDLAYPDGFDPGSLTVQSVEMDGQDVAWAVQGTQDQVLAVELPAAVEPGEHIQLTFTYTVDIPACYGRFGYGENTWSLVNAHPILCIYDDTTGQWYDSYPYYAVGDPFYSQAADYEAVIRVPKGYEVAATGSQTTDRSGDTWVTTVSGPAMRDFGFVVSDDFKVIEEQVGDTTVRSWYFGPDTLGEQAAQAAADAVACYSRRFGSYSWDELDVVMCDFYIGGMEYPGMVLIDASQYTLPSAMTMEMIVAHEVGHQWWYAAVGSNQITEPWLDEALTEFSTCVYFEDTYGDQGEEFRDSYVLSSYDMMEAIMSVDDTIPINSPVTSFSSNYDYSLVVYGRGAQMFLALRDELGDDAFYRSLQQYYKDHRFGLADGEDLVSAFESGSGQDLSPWFSSYLS